MNVVYEVTVIIDPDLREAYEHFMQEQHIPDLIATGCFVSASFETSGLGRYRIRYKAHDRASLDRYLENDATRLRGDFAQHFPEGIEVTREEWAVLKCFP